jgi:hypothetical protein
MRLNKLPYKKIASHLDKTELACRLHYHQLSHGNNRRKRTNSISSNTSDKSTTSPSETTHASGISSVLAAGKKGSNLSVSSSGAVQKSGNSNALKLKGKPLLPKPVATSGHGSIPRGKHVGKGKPLRVNCSIENIDKEKLLQIVDAQRQKFWESVATAYGGTFTPDFLEQAYNDGTASIPPTPAISPSTSIKSGASIIGESLLDTRFSAGSPEITEIPEELEPMDLSDNSMEEIKPEQKVEDAHQDETTPSGSEEAKPVISENISLSA